VSANLQQLVATTADTAELHAPAPTLLLELQTLLGALSATVTAATERGRRPFRPGTDWSPRLGELAYGVYLLADQTGVDLDEAVNRTAQHLELRGQQAKAQSESGWPFEKS
jgi:peptidoglycan/LPS O-acetylase OafA/YrhL